MAQAGQKSERHGANTRNGHHCDHPHTCLQSLQQWSQGNQGNLHAHLPVRLPESQLLSVRFQLCGVGLRFRSATLKTGCANSGIDFFVKRNVICSFAI